VAKFRADINAGNSSGDPLTPSATTEHGTADENAAESGSGDDLLTTATTIGVIGVAVALFDLALIPGMVIGVAASFAPKYVPKIGDRLQPLFNSTVRGAYKVTRKARSAVAEAQERVHDIAAELEAEEAAQADAGTPARAVS
jgi:hypothetical protein